MPQCGDRIIQSATRTLWAKLACTTTSSSTQTIGDSTPKKTTLSVIRAPGQIHPSRLVKSLLAGVKEECVRLCRVSGK